MYCLSLGSRESPVQSTGKDLSTAVGAEKLNDDLTRVAARCDLTASEITSNLTRDVTKLAEALLDIFLGLAHQLAWSACTRWALVVTLEFGVLHSNFLL